jgi:hypothetical protein
MQPQPAAFSRVDPTTVQLQTKTLTKTTTLAKQQLEKTNFTISHSYMTRRRLGRPLRKQDGADDKEENLKTSQIDRRR